jgi:hypothetical protein
MVLRAKRNCRTLVDLATGKMEAGGLGVRVQGWGRVMGQPSMSRALYPPIMDATLE